MPLDLPFSRTGLSLQECRHCGQSSLPLPAGEPPNLRTSTNLMAYLRNNVLPEADENAVKAILPVLKSDVDVYDEQIRRLEETLHALRPRRDATEASITQLSSLLAPIRRLPREILDTICLYSLPSDWTTADMGSVKLPFAQICHTWREVALASSRVWAHMSLGRDSPHKRYYRKQRWRDIMPVYIRRSRAHAVSLSALPFTENDVVSNGFFWKLVGEVADRLSTLRLRLWSSLRVENFPSALPALTTLELGLQEHLRPDKLVGTLQLRHTATSIRSLTLFEIHPHRIDVEWSRLRELVLTAMNVGTEEEILAAVRRCINLEYLEIGLHSCIDEEEIGMEDDVALIHLRKLKTLRGALHIVPILRAPLLQELHADLQRERHNILMPTKIVKEGLSIPTLETLTIEDIYCRTVPALHGLSGVRHLRLIQNGYFGPIDCEILDMLKVTPETVAPLPGLVHLEINGSNTCEESWVREDEETVEEVVDSRVGLSATDDVAALQRLTVKIPDAVFSNNFLAWLGELDGRGVTVEYLDSQTAHNCPFPIRRVEEEDSDEESL
ncbi:hypothetical protein GGF50DRAFT_116863 [Schizophyllum commune]